jgi:hypothetical protein
MKQLINQFKINEINSMAISKNFNLLFKVSLLKLSEKFF